MNTLVIDKSTTHQQPTIEYPASDGQPMAETEVHVLAMFHLIGALRYFFRKVADIYVIGSVFLYYREGDPKARKAPDVMVIKGVDKRKRRSFKTWEEKAVPCVVIEVTSKETKKEDTVSKLSLYASLGIAEYFLFDPLHEYLDNQLEGYRLDGPEYVPMISNEDGDIFSEELQLILRTEVNLLRVVDPHTGLSIPNLDEAVELAETAIQRAEQEAQRAEQEAQRAEQEAQRAAVAEAEVARLQAYVEQMSKRNDS